MGRAWVAHRGIDHDRRADDFERQQTHGTSARHTTGTVARCRACIASTAPFSGADSPTVSMRMNASWCRPANTLGCKLTIAYGVFTPRHGRSLLTHHDAKLVRLVHQAVDAAGRPQCGNDPPVQRVLQSEGGERGSEGAIRRVFQQSFRAIPALSAAGVAS